MQQNGIGPEYYLLLIEQKRRNVQSHYDVWMNELMMGHRVVVVEQGRQHTTKSHPVQRIPQGLYLKMKSSIPKIVHTCVLDIATVLNLILYYIKIIQKTKKDKSQFRLTVKMVSN